MIIDSHCHLDYPELYDQIDDVVKRAKNNNVNYMLSICTTLESFEKIKLIVRKFDNIFGTFGIHPHETKNFLNIDCKYILNLMKKNKKIIGIGETGLDYYYNHSDKNIQKKSLIEQITAAAELNNPVIVHSRNADIHTYEIIKEEKKNSEIKVLMHCFTGSKEFAKKLLDLNCYISLSGIITFKNSLELIETASIIPNYKLLIETDSPYLAPIPFRGKCNEPAYLKYIAIKLAQIKKISEKEIMINTSNNFLKIFNLK